MPLERILEVLAAKAQAEISEIEEGAEEQARTILDQAEVEAIRIRERHIATIRPRIESERARRINTASLAAQRVELEMRESLIVAAFDAAGEELACIRHSSEYPAVLEALISEVFDELGTSARFVVDPQDADLVRQHLSRQGVDADITPEPEPWGGVIGHSSDRRLTVDNTLKTRLNQARRRFRGEVAALFRSDPAVPADSHKFSGSD